MSCCRSNSMGLHCDCEPCGVCTARGDGTTRSYKFWLALSFVSVVGLLVTFCAIALAIYLGACR